MLSFRKIKNNAYLIILSIPIIFSFFWHFNNTQIPVSDAIGWLEASIKILEPYWNTGSISNTLYELFSERSWRPVIFHLFVVPFLWLTNGNFLFTTLIVHVFFVFLSTLIIYKIFRLRLDQSNAAICTSVICLSTNIMFGGIGLPLFAEISFTPFFLCTIYFLIKSNFFVNKNYSILFSIFFFLIFATRPVEALIYISLPLIFFFYKSVSENKIHLITVVKSILLSFTAIALLCISRFIPQTSKSIQYIDPPHSLEVYTIFSSIIVFITLAVLIYYLYLKNKTKFIYSENNYLLLSFKIHTLLIFIWWFSHFSNLYEWVYQTSLGSIVSYYETADKLWLLIWALKSSGLYIFPIILSIFILTNLLNYLKKIKYKFFDEYYYLLLTIPLPWIIYLFSVQGFYRKVSLSMVCFLIFLLMQIMSKNEFVKLKKIVLIFLLSIQVLSVSSHTFLSNINDQFWSINNRNTLASKFIGIEYPLPVNIHPNYHDKIIDFIKKQGIKYNYKRFGITVDELGEPVDAFVLMLLCRTQSYICSLPYNARLNLLSDKQYNFEDLTEEFKKYLSFFNSEYDTYFLINPKGTNMKISKEESEKALNFAMNKSNTSPSARFSYYLKYLYSSEKLSENNMSLGECIAINRLYTGCIINILK